MSTYDATIAAKEKFKESFWKNSAEKFNVIKLGVDFTFDEKQDEIISEEFFLEVYLFDMAEVIGMNLPPVIDGVEIKYLPVVDKENSNDP